MGEQNCNSWQQEWRFDTRKAYGMSAVAFVVGGFGLFGFGWISHSLGAGGGFSVRVAPDQAQSAVLWVVGITLGIILGEILLTAILILVHEWCHGLAFRAVGATPRYGAKMIAWFFPIFYATAPGRWLTRWQFGIVLLAPTAAVNLIGVALLVALGSWSWVLVIPLAAHLGGCVGDWWVGLVTLRLPSGTRIEDSPHGFRYQLV
jgi:hypothetical protein